MSAHESIVCCGSRIQQKKLNSVFAKAADQLLETAAVAAPQQLCLFNDVLARCSRSRAAVETSAMG